MLIAYQAPEKLHHPRRVHLVVDALYFGERKEDTSWSSVVFRDPRAREDLWWEFPDRETTDVYQKGRIYLESLGYTILSVTGDGFGGIRQAFSGIPFQMCQVHMERLVIKGTTRNPQLEAGKVLYALIRSLHHMDKKTFTHYFNTYLETYRTFLNEKTTNPLTGDIYFTHDPLRKATLSVIKFLPYLFTFENNKKIPKTTNSLEGHFTHIRDVVDIHRGLSRPHKQKVLNSLFLASTIAPTPAKLKYCL